LVLLDQEARDFGDSDLIHKTDSLNMIALQELTESHGWHPKAWIILWHQRTSFPDGEIWPYFKALINKEIQNCRVKPSFWVDYEDFREMRSSGKQIYGSMPGSFKKYPLLDVTRVDSLRASVGLFPLWYMNKIYDWPLPEGYPETVMLQSK